MVKQIHMTSFRRQSFPSGFEPFSVAVYQPKGMAFKKIPWTDIRKNGRWTRPREFIDCVDPAAAYWRAMYDLYVSRLEEAQEWVRAAPERVALLCWCPYDRAAQRQLEEFGSFICHTGPLGSFIVEELGVAVSYDNDRSEGMYGVAPD